MRIHPDDLYDAPPSQRERLQRDRQAAYAQRYDVRIPREPSPQEQREQLQRRKAKLRDCLADVRERRIEGTSERHLNLFFWVAMNQAAWLRGEVLKTVRGSRP